MKNIICLCATLVITSAVIFSSCKKKALSNEQKLASKWQLKESYFINAQGVELKGLAGNTKESPCPRPTYTFNADKSYTFTAFAGENEGDCLKTEKSGTWKIENDKKVTLFVNTPDGVKEDLGAPEITKLNGNVLEVEVTLVSEEEIRAFTPEQVTAFPVKSVFVFEKIQ